jgi:deoxyribonuclease IV
MGTLSGIMEKLIFGISGLPLANGSRRFNYASGIEYISSLGLDAMELLFVRSVNITDKNSAGILRAKVAHNVYLSAHGSYYINLNADTLALQEQSLERIRQAAEALSKVQGGNLTFHPGFYLKNSNEETYATIRANLERLPDMGITYRLETTGKSTQFGAIEELVSLCKEIYTCKLCIDFSHIHARNNGGLKEYDDFAAILQYVSDELGPPALQDLHFHIGGIRYSEKGELNHLPLRESDFDYVSCLKALKDFKVKGCVIAEGPEVENDALLLKKTYETM